MQPFRPLAMKCCSENASGGRPPPFLALLLNTRQVTADLGGAKGMRPHQRGIDLLLDLQYAIERLFTTDKDELRDLLVEVQALLRELLARDVIDPDSK